MQPTPPTTARCWRRRSRSASRSRWRASPARRGCARRCSIRRSSLSTPTTAAACSTVSAASTARWVSGYPDLPAWTGTLPVQAPYAALVDFYDDRFRDQPVRVAVLLQPVAGANGLGMATIQVAETLELRHALARQILVDTLWRQAALLGLIALLVVLVVQRATQPVRELSERMRSRAENDLSPISAPNAPRELLPLVEATNQVMDRLSHLLEHQKRFVRDTVAPAAHAAGGAEDAAAVGTARATSSRRRRWSRSITPCSAPRSWPTDARPGQGRAAAPAGPGAAARLGADRARGRARPGAADRRTRGWTFRLATTAAPVRAHEWALRELTRNLLHNAVKPAPRRPPLSVTLGRGAGRRCSRSATAARASRRTSATACSSRSRPVPQPTTGAPAPGWGWLSATRSCARSAGASASTTGSTAPGRPGSWPASGCRWPTIGHHERTPCQRPSRQVAVGRALFQDACAGRRARSHKGRVSVNGLPAKASRDLQPGDRVELRQGDAMRTVQVLALSAMRGPAPVAQALYAETADSIASRQRAAELRRLGAEPAPNAWNRAGRPSATAASWPTGSAGAPSPTTSDERRGTGRRQCPT